MHKRGKQIIKKQKNFEPKIQQFSVVLSDEDGEGIINYYEVEKPENYFNWAIRNGFKLYGSKDLIQSPNIENLISSTIPAEIMAKVFLGNLKGSAIFEKNINEEVSAKELTVEDTEKLNQEGYMYLQGVDNSSIVKFYLKDFKYSFQQLK